MERLQENLKQWKKDEAVPFRGWDFSYISERHHLEEPDWNYEETARQLVRNASSVLDIGTGGGEVFARLAPFPQQAVAIEDWHPNVAIAKQRLNPLGAKVMEMDYKKKFPFQDGEFDLVLNRHSALPIPEISRVLRKGGIFFTQQVNGHNLEDLAREFGAKQKWPNNVLSKVQQELEQSGFQILNARNWTGWAEFYDVGAIVFFLKNIPWIVEGFRVRVHRSSLENLQKKIDEGHRLRYTIGRFLIKAVKSQ